MKNLNKKGFTLIELLVVITIIWILATWATATYTSQIQKARDTTRVNDMKALQSWIEQLYQDSWTYPNAWAVISSGWPAFVDVKKYTPKLPKDPKTWQKSNDSSFDYSYSVASDSNGIWFQIYEVSTHFENSGNISSKAASDWWSNNFRLELWISLGTLSSQVNRAWLWASWVDTASSPTYICENSSLNPAAATATTVWTCPTAWVSWTANSVTLVIR